MTQRQKVLRHLQSGSITPIDALREYSIMRLAAIICDLKAEGYDIKSEMQKSVNKFGEPCRFSKYTLS